MSSFDPHTWQADVHQLWEQGQRQDAIDRLLQRINAHQPAVPRVLGLQLIYYIFLLGDLKEAERFLRMLLHVHPDDNEILENLAVMLSRQGRAAEAIPCFERVLARDPRVANAWDGLTACLAEEKRYDEAARSGEQALALKTEAAKPLEPWQLPARTPRDYLARPGLEERRDVVSFSIWGANPRYLRGALRNALLIPELYPGWQARFYLDESVPQAFRALLTQVGADCRLMPADQTLRQKLCWRFLVANDPGVGRFLVRDCDSVVNQREVAAVQQWLASERWFHVMRDWWTHTDPILAGLWGGISGVLPDLQVLLSAYRPVARETANVDQWFLRDVLWGSIRPHALIHDRCFRSAGSQPWPTPTPSGSHHVGQDEFAFNRVGQAIWLAGWLQRYPCLQLQGEEHLVGMRSIVKSPSQMPGHASPGPQSVPQSSLRSNSPAWINIDLRHIQTVWISMEEFSPASQRMRMMLDHAGFQRASWSPGVAVSAEPTVSRERLHAIGVALAHRQALLSHFGDEPLLLLEDDVEIEEEADLRFDVPGDTDAVWVGISRYGKPIIAPLSHAISRVSRMFSTHAVLYLTGLYKQHAVCCIEQCVDCNLPFDIGLSFYQELYLVCALNHAAFYQSRRYSGAHDFQDLTRGRLDAAAPFDDIKFL